MTVSSVLSARKHRESKESAGFSSPAWTVGWRGVRAAERIGSRCGSTRAWLKGRTSAIIIALVSKLRCGGVVSAARGLRVALGKVTAVFLIPGRAHRACPHNDDNVERRGRCGGGGDQGGGGGGADVFSARPLLQGRPGAHAHGYCRGAGGGRG
eukprot:scaffold119615_cov63-Phaeocystis_antarctica.AAC.2